MKSMIFYPGKNLYIIRDRGIDKSLFSGVF